MGATPGMTLHQRHCANNSARTILRKRGGGMGNHDQGGQLAGRSPWGGRRRWRLGIGAIAIAACLGTGAAAALEPVEQEILDAHNRYRTEVGVAPLGWSAQLASQARSWATELARTGRFEHAANTNGAGENLAIATAGAYRPRALVGLWGAERQYFRPGRFPQVSSTGRWGDVGHYTQMVWRSTTAVGCAIATGDGMDVLVCRYTPPGNVTGQRVY